MGQNNSTNTKDYVIPVNQKLSTDISRSINIKPSPDEISRFKRIMNKKFNREFAPSQFTLKFQQNKKGVKHVSSLLSLIYSKNTNAHLKEKSNRTLYESVFNYNIIEKDSKGYEEFNKNIISQMGLFINGEQCSQKDNNAFVPQLTTFKTEENDKENNSKESSNQDDPFLDKNSSHIKKSNTANDTDNENIIKAIQEIKESKIGQSYYNNVNSDSHNNISKKSTLNNQRSIKENNANSPFAPSDNESMRLTEGDERKKGSPTIDNQSVSLHFDNNNKETHKAIILKGKPGKASSPGERTSKTNRNKGDKRNPKKQPLVNIKINLKDLIKQDVYETSSLFPKDRFKATMERRIRSRSRTPSPNRVTSDPNDKEFNDSVNNLTTIKASDISQININDGSFLDLVDALAQPNIKEEKRIHSRTPKKRTTTYEKENQKVKTKNREYIKMFNVTNKNSSNMV